MIRKHLLATVLIAFLVFTGDPLVCSASAPENHFVNLSELDLTIEIPSSYTVITRETPHDDPAYEKLGGDPGDDWLTETDCYLFAADLEQNLFIEITSKEEESLIYSLDRLSDEGFQATAAYLSSFATGANSGYSSSDGFAINRHRFIWLRIDYGTLGDFGKLCLFTIRDNMFQYISLYSLEGNITKEQEEFLYQTVATVTYPLQDKERPLSSPSPDPSSLNKPVEASGQRTSGRTITWEEAEKQATTEYFVKNPLYNALSGALSFALLAAFGVLINAIRRRFKFKEYLVDSDFAGSAFTYRGKLYDRERYIQDRVDKLETTSLKKLLRLEQDVGIARSNNPEYDAAELEAVQLAIDKALKSKKEE